MMGLELQTSWLRLRQLNLTGLSLSYVGRCPACCTHGSHVTPVHPRTLRRRWATCSWPFASGTNAARQVSHCGLDVTTQITCLNVGSQMVYGHLGFLWFSRVPPDTRWNSTSDWVSSASFHVVSNSFPINHPTFRRLQSQLLTANKLVSKTRRLPTTLE